MSHQKQGLVWLVVFAVYLAWVFGAFGAELPDWRGMPGWRRPDRCHEFSVAFVNACNDNGVPAARVTFDWRRSGFTGRHAVVVFKHQGKLCAMDNEHLKPWSVTGTNDVQLFRPLGAFRSVNNTTLCPQPPRGLGELFPVLPL